ncbi:MAG: hypothetical protein Q9216_006297 [Gyalolechia sp. 2 TL-2023]
MNFLNGRKAEPEESFWRQDQKSRRKKDKAADAEAEISRFFASSKDQIRPAEDNRAGKKVIEKAVRKTREQQMSSLPPVDLPKKPFLGFGSCGPGHISPVLSVSNADSRRSPSPKLSSQRSTTYYTWSQTQLSKHSPSSSPRRSPRLPSTGHQNSHPNLDFSPKRRKGNPRGETHVSPPAPDSDKESHIVVEDIPSVPLVAHKRLTKSSVKEDHTEINCHKEAKVCPDSSSTAALPLTTACQSRPELLGAILDALLGRVSNSTSGASQQPRPARPSSEGIREQVSALEAILESQTPHERNSKPADIFNDVPSDSQPCPPQRSTPSLRTNFQVADRPPSRVSSTQISPKQMQEIHPSSEKPDIQRNHFQGDQTVGTANKDPSASNAWMGYDNIYQDQEEAPNKCRHGNASDIRDAEDGGHTCYSPSGQVEKEAFAYASLGVDDQQFNPYKSHPFEDIPDVPNLVEDGSKNPMHANPQMHQNMYENFGPFEEDVLQTGQAINQEAARKTSNALLGVFDNLDSGQDFEGHADTIQRFSPTSFLGGRYPAASVTSSDIFSPWGFRRTPNYRISRVGISSRGSGADGETVDEAPLNGFWRPNKLY